MKITIEVKPGSKKEEIIECSEGHLIVHVKEKRIKGKANSAVLKLIKKQYDRPVKIVSGSKSRIKIIEIED
jgi:uncharacterized protein (TIGR00251 family)